MNLFFKTILTCIVNSIVCNHFVIEGILLCGSGLTPFVHPTFLSNSLSKPIFPCERVDARWGKLDCEQRLCDLQGTTTFGDDI